MDCPLPALEVRLDGGSDGSRRGPDGWLHRVVIGDRYRNPLPCPPQVTSKSNESCRGPCVADGFSIKTHLFVYLFSGQTHNTLFFVFWEKNKNFSFISTYRSLTHTLLTHTRTCTHTYTHTHTHIRRRGTKTRVDVTRSKWWHPVQVWCTVVWKRSIYWKM